MKHIPLIKAGQGRTNRSIRRDAGHVGWIFLLAVCLIVLAFLRRAVG